MSTDYGNHDGHTIILDQFLQLPGVNRVCPGNCYCATCKRPVPLIWNNGDIIPATAENVARARDNAHVQHLKRVAKMTPAQLAGLETGQNKPGQEKL